MNEVILTEDQISHLIKLAAEVGAKTALDRAEREKVERKKLSAERRVESTKQLFKNYRTFAGIAQTAVYTVQTPEMRRTEIEALMTPGRYESLTVEAIKANAIRSEIMCAHIRSAMQIIKAHVDKFGTKTDKRRWRVTEQLYICMDEPRKTAQEIADEEGLSDESSVYRDFNAFCVVAAKYIFGVSAVLDSGEVI